MQDGINGRPRILGIAGPSGSGKTTIAKAIVERIKSDDVLLLHHDNYYRDLSEVSPEDRAEINYDHPDALENELFAEHLDLLVEGHSVTVPRYDFHNHVRLERGREVAPKSIIIVEGILALAVPELRDRMDIKVYVDTDSDICFIRRAARDISARGRDFASVADQYLLSVRPMFHEFVLPSRQSADVIIARDDRQAAIGFIASALNGFAQGETRHG